MSYAHYVLPLRFNDLFKRRVNFRVFWSGARAVLQVWLQGFAARF